MKDSQEAIFWKLLANFLEKSLWRFSRGTILGGIPAELLKVFLEPYWSWFKKT